MQCNRQTTTTLFAALSAGTNIERIREPKHDYQIARNNMIRSQIKIFRVLTVSGVRGTSFDIKIRDRFIEINYSAPDRYIIFITNVWYFIILEIIWYG